MTYQKKYTLILTLFFTCLNQFGMAQTSNVENTLRSNGMIYVVVGVLVIIFIGIIVYLLNLDKKVSRLEEEIEDLN